MPPCLTTVHTVEKSSIKMPLASYSALLLYDCLLPARASEQGNVIGSVHISESAVALSIGECGSTLYVGLSRIVRNLIQKSTV